MFKALLLGSAMTLMALPALAQTTPQEPWLDARLTPDARADAALKAMTQDEKLQLVFGYFSTEAPWMNFHVPQGGLPDSAGVAPGLTRLGVPAQTETDAGVGVATQRSPNPRLRTALPSGMATAATWDRDLAFQGGAMIGHEAKLSGFNVMLAGGVNLARDPRNGRNFEYAGEDPLLAGTIDGEEIKGIQSNHIVSTLKHYAFNDQSTSQSDLSVKIGEAAARGSDLLAFQIANEVGQPGSVMCAYNLVRGDYACESDWLLNQVLKQDWGFKGYVMTDWGATHSTVKAANTGLDQQSGWPFGKDRYFAEPLKVAIASGEVAQSRLDDMARRILYALFATGAIDDPVKGDQSDRIDYAADAAITQADAEGGIVLLKNDGVLPLAKAAKKIVFIGAHSDVGVLSGGGSSQVYPHGGPQNGLILPNEGPAQFPGPMVWYPSSPMQGVQARSDAQLIYNDGRNAAKAARLAADADVAVVFATQWSAEGMDQKDLSLPNHQDDLIAAVAKANPHTVVVLETGDPVTMPWLDQVGAVVEAWFPGTSGGEAIARVLTGEVNPSGHLPITFPASLDQLPRPVLPGQKGDPKTDGWYTADYDIDGAAVGYKWFDKKGYKPLFPFGYGLSYTTFAIDGLVANGMTPQGLKLTLDMTNTGAVAGKGVAQIYVAGDNWEAPRRLGGFAKLDLAPGASQTTEITVDPRLLATYDPASKHWIVAAGRYTATAGQSAADAQQSVEVTLARQVFDVRGRPVGD